MRATAQLLRQPAAFAKEDQEQIWFIDWFHLAHPNVLIYHIPNGAHLHGDETQRKRQMAKLKAMGLVPGVQDLEIPAWKVIIEFKRRKGGSISTDQDNIHTYFTGIGWTVIVARGWEDGRRQIEDWLANQRGAA